MAEIFLKPGREKNALLHHPWIYSQAVMREQGAPAPGDVVQVRDASGAFVAQAFWNPASRIPLRLLSWDQDEPIDDNWFREKIKDAVSRRAGIIDDSGLNAFRVIYSEADLLPGLIVDKYAGTLVMQSLCLGLERIKETIAVALMELVPADGVYERSDAEVRRLEGLESAVGILCGRPESRLEILENGYRFLVDVKEGQKTGFYLDQRVNRLAVAKYARGCEVLDAFSYTGAFAVYALAHGATDVVRLDSSAASLKTGEINLGLNGLADRSRAEQADVFEMLRRYRDSRRTFDMIVLDPPRFAPTESLLKKATRAYKDINLLAFKLLRPTSILATFSCSAAMSEDLFQKVVFGASLDAGREAQIIERLSQGPDHPIRLSFPESAYLKGLICRVM